MNRKSFKVILFAIFWKSALSYLTLNQTHPSPCYANGSAHQCMPPLMNIVENMIPNIKSMCRKKTHCNSNQKTSYFITDYNILNNHTCWSSEPLQSNHVNITFSLEKRFEIYYISLTPCNYGIPNAVAIYKSNDFGITWTIWHYFAENCSLMFNMKEENPSSFHSEFTSRKDQYTAKCYPLSFPKTDDEPVIAFSTAFGGMHDSNGDSQLIDWMTASDIRISLFKFNNTKINQSNLFHLTRHFPKEVLSLADISIGGRCKCNGHANVCDRNVTTGKLECICQHNTEGQDCERCKQNYFDLPWARATVNSPALCKKCECNLHSSSCNFSQDLYIIRKQLTGGVCTNCQHNTAGTRCHYCAEGYYRDWTKPLDHKFVCKRCVCHAIGAKFRNKCDKRTSQCTCKKGVTGEICNRCMPGYRQTKSSVTPCVRNIQMEPAENRCKPCNSRRSRIKFKKFCRKDAVFLATLQSQEIIGDYIRFDVTLDTIWHFKESMDQLYPNSFEQPMNNLSGKFRQTYSHKQTSPLWVKSKDLRCSCVPLQLGQTYLFIMKSTTYQYQNRAEILIKFSRSVILNWNSSWKRRLNRFKQKEENGECSKFQTNSQFRKSVQWTEST